MTQWRLFQGETATVSTREYHANRDRARHLEQDGDTQRLQAAAILVLFAQRQLGRSATVSDLGCGDGGLLSLIQYHVGGAWGYDFTPANAAGWPERGVKAEALDVFGEDSHQVRFGEITVVTEVLEHLSDPHAALRWIGGNSPFVVASSPWDETGTDHDDCHAWAFDHDGYQGLMREGGYTPLQHIDVGRFQVILGERR